MKKITLLILVSISVILFSFKKKIYKKGKVYYYEAIYITKDSDTLTKEVIKMEPKGRPWLFQWSQRTIKETYATDWDKLVDWIHPVNRSQKSRKERQANTESKGEEWRGGWRESTTTGIFENGYEVWTHPFRSNQYVYTELAPFPEIDKERLCVDSTWCSGLMLGYDNWKGTIMNSYTVVNKSNYKYQGIDVIDCWKIHAVGKHSNLELGCNTNDFLFHPEYGFVEMKYEFYNGVRIIFKLKKVETK